MIWRTSVITMPEAEEAVTELLTACVGPSPSAYIDADTGQTTVSVYSIARPANAAETKRTLQLGLKEIRACGLDIGAGRVALQKLPPENWADSWKRHFSPLEIGTALLVKPSWNKRKPRRGQSVVVLDPGLSFGTGQHPTTEFCLRELVRGSAFAQPGPRPPSAGGTNHPSAHNSKRPVPRRHRAGSPQHGNSGASFLDIGTGSGILAIAASKIGYAPVHAFDHDPQSILVAKENTMANHVANLIKLSRADLRKLPRHSAQRYDVVCANLLANLLISERDRILARVKPNGVLVVAGILKREFPEVQTAYEAAGWRLVASKAQKEWRSGTFCSIRRPPPDAEGGFVRKPPHFH